MVPKELLAIRVTCLQGATLLGFRIPHHFCDGESMYQVVKAYRNIVAGQKIKTLIPPPDTELGLSTIMEMGSKSPLPEGMEIETTPYLHPSEKLVTSFWRWLGYVGYSGYKMIASKIGLSQKSEEKLLHLPRPLVERWKTQCQKELPGFPNISKLDAISAWLLHTSVSSILPDTGPLDLIYIFSYRFALPPPPETETYLKNSFYELRIHWDSLLALQKSTLPEVVKSIRTSVLQNRQPSVIKSNLEFQEEHATDFVSPCNMRLDFMPFISSWTTFEYQTLDFSAALSTASNKDVSPKLGKVVFTLPRVTLPLGATIPFVVVMKDDEGGYWIRADLPKTCWKGHGL